MKSNSIFLIFLVLILNHHLANAQDEILKPEVKVSPTTTFHGRIQYDYEFLRRKSTIPEKFNGSEFRRVYLSTSGKVYKNIKYKVEFDFAGAKVTYTDVFIKFIDLPRISGDVVVGSFVEPTGLEMATSSKYIPMLERAMFTKTQNARQGLGVMYENLELFKGNLGLQFSYTFNGKPTKGFKDDKLGDGGNFVLRLTSPIYKNKNKNHLVHLGINYESRKRTKEPVDYTLKFRPDNHLGGKIVVDFENLKTQSDFGFEVAANLGPFSAQAEYELAKYLTSAKDYYVHGYYGLLSYFVTGDHRGYKNAAYSRVRPNHNLSLKDGKFGAIELLARYSMMQYSSTSTSGQQNYLASLGLGFNWYLNPYTRFMYNHNITNFFESAENPRLNADLFRLQVDF